MFALTAASSASLFPSKFQLVYFLFFFLVGNDAALAMQDAFRFAVDAAGFAGGISFGGRPFGRETNPVISPFFFASAFPSLVLGRGRFGGFLGGRFGGFLGGMVYCIDLLC
jgi:hypothetical protein